MARLFRKKKRDGYNEKEDARRSRLPLSPLGVLRKEERGRKEVADFKKERFKQRYKKSVAGRIGSGINTVIKAKREFISTNRAYKNKILPVGRRISSGRGRPAGSYDPRYAAYGGVYGYRKVLNAQLRQQRLQAIENSAVSPQQQQILNQIRAREQAQRINPENRIIPDTTGYSSIGSYNQEIDDSANLVP